MKKSKLKENLDTKKVFLGMSISLIFVIVMTFMTVGFALYTQVLSINGTVKFKTDGDFGITDVQKISSSNTTDALPSFTLTTVNLNLEFVKSDETNPVYRAVYDITVTNDTFFDQTVNSFDFAFTLNNDQDQPIGNVHYELTGVESGDMIEKLSSKVATLTITFTPSIDQDFYPIGGLGEIDNEPKPNGNMVASLTGSTVGDVSDDKIASFTVKVTSTYETDRTFHFVLGNPKLEVCNSTGGTLSDFTIPANTENQTYTFYVKQKSGETFPTDSITTSVTLKSSGLPNVSCGNITLTVDKEEVYTDTTPPVISGVTAVRNNEIGVVTLSWSGEDDYSGVDHYTILVKDGNDNTVRTLTTTSDETEITINNLSNGATASTYNFIVYGIDNEGNVASVSDINNASTSPGYASASGANSFQWVFTVTFTTTGVNSNGNSTVNIGDTYTATVTAQNNYALPNNITVTMGGTATTNFTYNQNNGRISIPNVTGNLVITVTGTYNGGIPCLVEGSKVRLANGEEKLVDDLNYDDLLLVYDHEFGGFTYEYPIWMENVHERDFYQLTTFDDGTSLKTVGPHSVFNVDTNRYSDISTISEGATIYKVDKNNKLYKAKIERIETIHKHVKYYDVVSTRFYNLVADDVLVNDGREALCNFYEFRENLLWSHRREYVLEHNIQLDYKDFKQVPYYLFHGLRAQDGAVLVRYNYITMKEFKSVFTDLLLNKKYIKEPNNILGKRIWTLSFDDGHSEKVFEGTVIKLPSKKKVKCYLNTTDNICYKPGETLKIWSGTHLISKY